MFDVVIVVGLLALMGFCAEFKNGWRAGLENMMMFLLAVAAYFCMVAAISGAGVYYLNNMGGWEMLRALDGR
jgi:MFS-type transporter involved in bile tolerance (Atg22 family)